MLILSQSKKLAILCDAISCPACPPINTVKSMDKAFGSHARGDATIKFLKHGKLNAKKNYLSFTMNLVFGIVAFTKFCSCSDPKQGTISLQEQGLDNRWKREESVSPTKGKPEVKTDVDETLAFGKVRFGANQAQFELMLKATPGGAMSESTFLRRYYWHLGEDRYILRPQFFNDQLEEVVLAFTGDDLSSRKYNSWLKLLSNNYNSPTSYGRDESGFDIARWELGYKRVELRWGRLTISNRKFRADQHRLDEERHNSANEKREKALEEASKLF